MSSKATFIAGLLVGCLMGGIGFQAGRLLHPGPYATSDLAAAKAPSGAMVALPGGAPGANFVSGTPSASANRDAHWKALAARPGNPARNQEMAAAIEELAASNPERALALAQGETNLPLRKDLLNAALRGWASVHPEAAGQWALAQPVAGREAAVAAILSGAAHDPELATQTALSLSQKDPERAGEYGANLIAALGGVGEFDRAAHFASSAPAEYRAGWLTAAYSSWGQYQPQNAAAAAAGLPDPEARQAALQAAYAGWSLADPKGLAEQAVNLPAGPDKTFTLTEALRNWAVNDPKASAEWMNHLESNPDLDAGVAAVATSWQLVQKPDVAVSWAESIVDPQLRSSTLATVLRQWAEKDPAAARHYAETSTDLSPEERTDLLADFNNN